MSIKLLIADGQEIVRLGLKNFLERTDIKIVAQAATGEQVLELARKSNPDVILMEVRLPGMDSLHVLGRLKLDMPGQRVVIFTAYENPRFLGRAVALGAEGYLLKTAKREELIRAIKAAAAGETNWSRTELRRVGAAMASPPAADSFDVSLTKRELEVLKQLTTGATNRDIAKNLKISYETTKEHVQHVLQKIGVTDRTQAAVWAVRNHVV